MTERALPVTRCRSGTSAEALDHGLALLRQAWASFDEPRPHQPPVARGGTALREPVAGDGDRRARGPRRGRPGVDEPRPGTPPLLRVRRLLGLGPPLADALAMSHDVNLAAAEAAPRTWWSSRRSAGSRSLSATHAAGGHGHQRGMVSNLTALMAARTRAFPEPGARWVRAGSPMCASAEAHLSVERAVEVLGLGGSALRDVPIDERRRMDPAALNSAIATDRAAGVTPMAVVATAGTTLTAGSVGPIRGDADVVEGTGAWRIVDGAQYLPGRVRTTSRCHFRRPDHATGLGRRAQVAVQPAARYPVLVRDQPLRRGVP